MREMTRAEIETKARAFLERCRGSNEHGPYFVDGPAFEAIVQREVELTMRQIRRQPAAQGQGDE